MALSDLSNREIGYILDLIVDASKARSQDQKDRIATKVAEIKARWLYLPRENPVSVEPERLRNKIVVEE